MPTNAVELYEERDLPISSVQLKKALMIVALFSLPMLAAVAVSLAARMEWLTILITVLWGAGALFLWEMKVSPVRAYRKHLKGLFSGLRRTAEGKVVSFSEDGAFKDGVFFNMLIINADPKMDPEGERLFYVDRCKPRPEIAPGDGVRLTSNGNYVTGWEKISGGGSGG